MVIKGVITVAIVQIICGALFIGMGLAMIYLKSSYVELTYKRQCQLRKNVDKEKWCKTAGRMATIFGYGWMILGALMIVHGYGIMG